jgi:hypothetical protein
LGDNGTVAVFSHGHVFGYSPVGAISPQLWSVPVDGTAYTAPTYRTDGDEHPVGTGLLPQGGTVHGDEFIRDNFVGEHGSVPVLQTEDLSTGHIEDTLRISFEKQSLFPVSLAVLNPGVSYITAADLQLAGGGLSRESLYVINAHTGVATRFLPAPINGYWGTVAGPEVNGHFYVEQDLGGKGKAYPPPPTVWSCTTAEHACHLMTRDAGRPFLIELNG